MASDAANHDHDRRLARSGTWSTRLMAGTASPVTTLTDDAILRAVTQETITRQLRAHESHVAHDDALSRVQMERVRIRVELASARYATADFVAPPSGRRFDTSPDASDDATYDALEKAYNLAFAVCSPERLERTEREPHQQHVLLDGRDPIEMDVKNALDRVLLERKKRALESAELRSTEDAIPVWKHAAMEEREWAIQQLRHSLRDQNEAQDPSERQADVIWKQHVVYSSPCVVDRAKMFETTRAMRHKILLHLAEACRSRVLGRARMRHQGESGFTRAAAPLKVQIPAMVNHPQQQPQSRVSPSEDTCGDDAPAESKAVGEYLVAELSSLASLLTQGHHQVVEKHQIAAETSTRLWREHQRALADFEVESRRLHESRQVSGKTMSRAIVEHVPNPFQRFGDTLDSAWKSSLKYVEYSDFHIGSASEAGAVPPRESELNRNIESLYDRGLNAIVLHRGDGARREIASFMLQVQKRHRSGNIHLIVTHSTRLEDWSTALSMAGVLVAPLWGTRGDRARVREMALAQIQQKWPPRALLIGVETLAEDIASLAAFPLHLCVFDLDMRLSDGGSDLVSAVWPYLFSLRCRQRLLLTPASVGLDVRALALFAYPSALCSRRKIMAWNCATFSKRHITLIISAVSVCIVCIDAGSSLLAEWAESLEKTTLSHTKRDVRTLVAVAKQVAGVPGVDETVENAAKLFYPQIGARARTPKKVVPRLGSSLASAEDVLLQSTKVKEMPLKRRFHSSTRRSRKRVSRCGKCAGCLAEDCLTCGHCQDMKKYGGPGLRKQSCKKRKCIKPKTWGLTRKKARRNDGAAPDPSSRDPSDEESSDSEGSDVASTENGGESAQSSDESAGENEDSSSSKTNLPTTLAEASDSGYESSHFSEETVDITKNEVQSDADETGLNGGQLERQSRAGRSRIMRCGKCKGCTSGDCMKCIHCRDMKKYGGLGQRKQSCKYRKCIAPKVVLLNQSREKQDGELDAGESGSVHIGGDDNRIRSKKIVEVDTTDLLLSTTRLDWLSVTQECELVVRKFQFFCCDVCLSAFTSQKQLDRHSQCVHASTANHQDDEWERVAEQLLIHPAHQLACLLASRRSINPNWQAPAIQAFAKLEGPGFEYFFLKPHAVLGRLTRRWSSFYKYRGISSPRGLPGGQVDCHLGDDGMIGMSHALIKWDHQRSVFTIECLSLRSPLSVNGRSVHFSSHPLELRSRDLIQVGACTAYFLLPTTTEPPTVPKIPRAEMRMWLEASVTKRRAQRAHDEAIQAEIRHQQVIRK